MILLSHRGNFNFLSNASVIFIRELTLNIWLGRECDSEGFMIKTTIISIIYVYFYRLIKSKKFEKMQKSRSKLKTPNAQFRISIRPITESSKLRPKSQFMQKVQYNLNYLNKYREILNIQTLKRV